MAKKYIVALTEDERQELEKLTTTGKHSASRLNHARILLKADINQPGARHSWEREKRSSMRSFR